MDSIICYDVTLGVKNGIINFNELSHQALGGLSTVYSIRSALHDRAATD